MMNAFVKRDRFPALALAAVLGFASAGAAGAAEPHHTVVPADAVQWGAAPPSLPAGAQAAVLYGDPGKAGPFVLRLKFPAGFAVPPHRHSKDEPVTVISGRLLIGAGAKLDRAAATALAPAGFVYLPAGMAHFAIADADTVVQINGMGPFDITYLNPNDDPRRQ